MIPNTITPKIIEADIQPSLTYRLDMENHRIMGKIDGVDSVMQAIKKILNTDKYAYEIYDWNYGQQLLKLLGKDFDYVIAEIPRIINDALKQDNRVRDVTDFTFEKTDYNSLHVTFLVRTIFGDLNYGTEVAL